MDKTFWNERWERNEIGFHRTEPHAYLQQFFPRLKVSDGATLLVPLCGKSLDLLWLRQQGVRVIGVEFSRMAVEAFFTENDLSPVVSRQGAFERWEVEGLSLLQGDLFDLAPNDLNEATLVYDRAALVALPPAMRARYVSRLAHLLPAGSRLLLVSNSYPAGEMEGPPFSVPATEVEQLFGSCFTIESLANSERIEEHPGLQQRGLTSFMDAAYLLMRK